LSSDLPSFYRPCRWYQPSPRLCLTAELLNALIAHELAVERIYDHRQRGLDLFPGDGAFDAFMGDSKRFLAALERYLDLRFGLGNAAL